MVKISQLPNESALTTTDYIPVVDAESTTTKKVTVDNLLDLVQDSIPTVGWTTLTPSFTFGSSLGQRSFTVTASSDVSTTLSKGMRMKFTRGTAPSTMCADMEASSSHYAKTIGAISGITFIDDFTIEGWVKLESYGTYVVMSRQATTVSGFLCYIDATGRLRIQGISASAVDEGISTSSLPLGKWVHVAATMDMSGTASTMYFDGVAQAVSYTNGGSSSLTQSGDLYIAANAPAGSATNFFDGKMCDLRLWSAVRTAAEIRDNYMQPLTGSESNLVGYWKLNGNFNDSSGNGNTLNEQGSTVATNADNPWKATEYGIITNVSGTTVTLFTGSEYTIPSVSLTGASYSAAKAPHGFVTDEDKWLVETRSMVDAAQSTPTANTWYNLGSLSITIPTGAWRVSYQATVRTDRSPAGNIEPEIALSTANNSASDLDFVSYGIFSSVTIGGYTSYREKAMILSSATVYYLNHRERQASTASIRNHGDRSTLTVRAICVYL